MRAVIQRVTSASVTVNQSEIAKIGRGLCVLVGIGTDDTKAEMNYIISKILSLRLFAANDNRPQVELSETIKPTQIGRGQEAATYVQPQEPSDPSNQPSLSTKQEESKSMKLWSQNVKDIRGEILIVSQFTLMAKTKKGNKPDFHNAMVGSGESRWPCPPLFVFHLSGK